MKKKECPFKIKGLVTQNYKGMKVNEYGVTLYEYEDNPPYDACDLRNLVKCVGEKICPIMKRN